MNIFEAVKNNVSLREAVQVYGLEVNRHGKALCPFHNDRHPSLYVADDHYYCFACGAHGDVIDFTAKLFDLKPYEAAMKLVIDFHLDPDKPPSAKRASVLFCFIGLLSLLGEMESRICAANAGGANP